MKLIVSITLLLLFILLQGTNATSFRPGQTSKRIDERHISEFRYVIYKNTVDDRFTTHTRSVLVLMDKDAFTEENLAKMYKLIAKRFPEPNWLEVWVSTNLWQVETPEEADMPKFSERGDDPHDDLHPRALLMRVNDNELYRYTPEGAPFRTWKTVMISK